MLTINGDNGDNDLRGWGFSGDETVNGFGGNDKIQITAGSDIYNGGSGNDTLYATDYSASIDLNLSSGMLVGGGVTKTALNFENYEGNSATAAIDSVRGNSDANLIRTYGGDDRVYISGGADTYDAGNDIDTLDASDYGFSVDVNLSSGTFLGGGISSKTTLNFENYEGNSTGAFSDVVRGNEDANIIRTYGGDDRIFISGGADTYDAGNDSDTLDASDYGFSVNVNLSTGAFLGGGITNKTTLNFEHYEGNSTGDFSDVVIGNDAANSINTYGGDDEIDGAGGDDTLNAGLGNNSIMGGSGNDTAVLAGHQVVGFRSGALGDELQVLGSDGNSTWVNADVETLQFDNGTSSSWQQAFSAYQASLVVDPLIDPGTGAPRQRDGLDLVGGKKADALVGSALNDDLNGDVKNDTLFGGAGADYFHLAIGGKKALNGKADVITDFSSAEGDKVVIHRGAFGAGNGSLVICADDSQLNAALATDASFAYNQASGQLFYNQNGSADGFGKTKVGGIMATIGGAPDLTSSDFLMV